MTITSSLIVTMSSKLRKDEVLRDDNWMAWKARIMQALRTHRLDGFPLGKYLPPDRDLEPAEYDAWETIDQAIIQYVKANINLILIPEFLEINSPTSTTQTSSETWNTLLQVYKSHTSQTANNLFRALVKTRANNSTNIIKHLTDIQNVRTKLANLGYPMEDYLFNGFLTSSLPRSWDTYTTGLQGIQASTGKEGKPALPTLQLMNILKSEYIRRKADQTGDVTYHSGTTANPKKRKCDSDNVTTQAACRICHLFNHTTDNCRWKLNGGYCIHCQ